MGPILETARERGIPVIEDAAQSIGAEYGDGGKRAGALGTIGAFSFFPSKNLGCFGDGGMVTTHDAGLAEKIRALRHHGAKRAYDHQMVGGNFRLDALQAAVLGVKLKHLDRWSEARRENARYYDRRLSEEGLVDKGYVQTPPATYARSGNKNYHIYNQYTLRVKDRDHLKAHLLASGVGCSVYYPIPLHLQACFIGLGHKAGSFPESERAAEEALSIPIYPELTAEQKEHVVRTLVSFYGDRRRTGEAEGGR
jgi:dTDP-4-amino-4,6-dideoxygalactose transaminase